jgi:elongation factor G
VSRGLTWRVEDIPADQAGQAEEYREKMLEAAAEADDDLMEKYLEEGDLSDEDLKKGLRQRTIDNEIVLAICGSAFKDKGVQPMLDAVVEFLPAPNELQHHHS